MRFTRILIPALLAGAPLVYGENIQDKVGNAYIGIDLGITEGERDDSFALGRIGYQISEAWGLEAGYLSSTDKDTPKDGVNLSALYYFNHFDNTSLFAKGLMQDDDEFTLGLGIGLQQFVYPNVSISPLLSYLHNDEGGDIAAQIGVNYFFGATQKTDMDSDKDGIPNIQDQCPSSPYNANVDSDGCEIATKPQPTSPPTPKPVDTDNDGVIDSEDQCLNTPKGDEVDVYGCTLLMDDDKDGIANRLDNCPTTPMNSKVDANGCAVFIDSDLDGVADSLDNCPNTPSGFSVNESGCTQYDLQTEEVQLEIRFANNSSEVKAESIAVLQEFATAINNYKLKNVEVQGHSSLDGSASYNLRLSEARAQSVADLLIKRFNVDPSVISAKGYGETQPVINEISDKANAINRRVVAAIQYE